MRDGARDSRLPPGQIATTKFPVMNAGSVPQINVADWDLHLFGAVKAEMRLRWDDVKSLPQSHYTSDVHCVTTWSRLDNDWEGVRFSDIFGLIEVDPAAKFVMVYGEQGYSANFRVDDLLREGVLLAYRYNQTELSPEHGFPLRLVVPHLYFWKSVKWVRGIEFSSEEKLGFWERFGYHPHGDPWLQERYADSLK
ncbi:sulfite oxidase-like oxidoreductase [Alicyclobacillus cycloheptanicus]|uniref:DMSO/TMAO reductase YedYZ molybdopterin-dependent catalytic subunit n=1 Tax=Alicyclobacillus cycloheptanicus TaxID=1457 RepID=A0ABT9XI77_9BACL|nr:sulfite oxidase-like oxidoreductase [Alicyclobacillus cycloheptanicus]MDQ0189902.1 DMSO/TMAO reductase YedYZ molybdopterin-dependent catalytic subunit [Alicyclobacillus cycloheptanicus]